MATRQVFNPKGLFNSLQYGFSQAIMVRGERRLLLSGQVGVDAKEQTVEGGVEAQTRRALDNIALLLSEAGSSLSDIVMLRLYIAEQARDDQNPIADALCDYFPEDPPPSSWIIVAGLSLPEWLIEIEAEAVL